MIHFIALLGATGSVGDLTLDVVDRHPDRFAVVGVAAKRNWRKLAALCIRFRPDIAALADEEAALALDRALAPLALPTRVIAGDEGLHAVATLRAADTVVSAIGGAAGFRPTLAAARAGKRILLANKEALVIGGAEFIRTVDDNGATLLPIESNHNAIFQCLPVGYARAPRASGVERLMLTASGRPFRTRPLAELATVTPDEACAQPHWRRSRKIRVDTATMMDKALEVIAAHWLYGLPADRIGVVMHPTSIVHSLVQYVDGSVLARLGNPDMRTPIAQALAYPERINAGVASLDLVRIGALAFEPLDPLRFPCLALGYRALTASGAAPAVLNAANEIAVAAFLDGHIAYTAIAEICADALASVSLARKASLEDALAADVTTRAYVRSRLRLEDGTPTRAMPARWQPHDHVRHKATVH